MEWARYPLRWPGRVWTAGRWHIAEGPPAVVNDAAERAAWLSGGEAHTQGWWLVAPAPAGAPATEPERQPEPDGVPAAIGAGLRAIHDRDADCCPFRTERHTIVDRIAAAVEEGLLDASALPEPYDRYQPQRLLGLARSEPPSDSEDLVVCHGTPEIAAFHLDGGEVSGFAGPSVRRLGVADRHHDLAIAHRSILDHFGPDALFGFYEGYGRDPHLVSLDHYILLDVLFAAIDAPSAAP